MKILLAAASLSVLATAAAAQTAQTSSTPAGDNASSSNVIGEVVVTAERRSARLQDTPIAITAASATQLKAQGVVDLQNLGNITPSFNTNQEVGFGTPFMRGVGSSNVTAGDEPSVATYIDGFYQGTSITAQIPFNNIDRVEILKGPQGTLYGRNAVGGLVNIITRTPQDTPEVEGDIGYGNYNTVTGDLYVTGPIANHVKADLAIAYQNQARGYSLDLDNNKRYGTDDYIAVRSKVVVDLGGDNSLTVGGSFVNSRDNIANVNLPVPGSTPLAVGADPTALYGKVPYQFAGNTIPRFEVQEYSLNATLKLDFGFADFVSLTQFRNVRSANQVEGDGTDSDGIIATTQLGVAPGGHYGDPLTPQTVIPDTFAYYSSETIPYFVTQELQLLSKPGGPVTWIIGGFFQGDQDGYTPLQLNFSQGPNGTLESIWTHQEVTALALYAQGSYAFTNGLTLTAGGRLNTEHHHNDGFINIPGVGDVTDDRNATFGAFTYHAAAEYRFSHRLMVYASTSKGFKSGIFDTTDVGGAPVKPETLYDYEAGFKADPAPYLRVDGNFYYYRDRDLQTFVNTPLGLSNLENVGGADMYGFELEAEIRPVSHLVVRGGLGLEHSEYTDTPSASVFITSPSGGLYTTNADVTGKQLVRTPSVTANASATYTIPLGDRGDVALNGALAYSGDYYWDELNLFEQKAYTTLDLSAKYTPPNSHWTLTVWGKNVTGTLYAIYQNPQQRYDSIAYAPPATFGATLGFKF